MKKFDREEAKKMSKDEIAKIGGNK